MSILQVIFCERHGLWANAFRIEQYRQFADDGCRGTVASGAAGRRQRFIRNESEPDLRIRETRSLTECWGELSQHRASLAVFETTLSNLDSIVVRILDLRRRQRSTRILVVGDRALEPYRAFLTEAGAINVVLSIRDTDRIVEAACQFHDSLPQTTTPLRERIWNSLPWKPVVEIPAHPPSGNR